MFGSDPPSVNTKLLNANRDHATRLAHYGEGVLQEFQNYRADMQNYTTDLMMNVVGQQMQSFQQQLEQSQALFDIAKSDRDYFERFYRPVEQAVRQEAMNWDSASEQAKARGEAGATVAQAFDAAANNERRRLESYGVDPSQTRSAALNRTMAVQRAAAQAGAMNQAADQRELQGAQMRANLVNQGNATANRALQTAAQGQAGASSAARTGALTTGTANRTVGSNYGGYQQAAGMTQGVGEGFLNLNRDYLNQYNAQLNEHNATIQPGQVLAGIAAQGIGGMAGSGAFNPYFEKGMTALGFSEGGAVPTPEEAGVAPVPPGAVAGGSPIEDRTPAALTPGEFIIPEDTVRWKGEEYFHKEISKAREAMAGGGSQAIPTGVAA